MLEAYRIVKALNGGIGGMQYGAVLGEIICDGLFGVHDRGSGEDFILTHIPTGRMIGRFNKRGQALRCGRALARLDAPWDVTTTKEVLETFRQTTMREILRLRMLYGDLLLENGLFWSTESSRMISVGGDGRSLACKGAPYHRGLPRPPT